MTSRMGRSSRVRWVYAVACLVTLALCLRAYTRLSSASNVVEVDNTWADLTRDASTTGRALLTIKRTFDAPVSTRDDALRKPVVRPRPTLDGPDAQGTGRRRRHRKRSPEASCHDVTHFDRHGGLWFYLAGSVYMFYGLAMICEGKFKDSIMEMTAALRIPPDVAGATIMAAGTSSPELFISLVALLTPGNDDMGAGTIVGSAIFNIAIIIGGAAIFCGSEYRIAWRPVMRDALVNCVVFLFLLGAFWDGEITFTESCVALLMYALYVGLMLINDRILALLGRWAPPVVHFLTLGYGSLPRDDKAVESTHAAGAHDVEQGSRRMDAMAASSSDNLEGDGNDVPTLVVPSSPSASTASSPSSGTADARGEGTSSSDPEDYGNGRARVGADHPSEEVREAAHTLLGVPSPAATSGGSTFTRSTRSRPVRSRENSDGDEAEVASPGSGMSPPPSVSKERRGRHHHARPSNGVLVVEGGLRDTWNTMVEWNLRILRSPFEIMFTTIPEPEGPERWRIPASFCMSLVWIAVMTYLMVLWSTKIGCVLHMDDAIVGVTLLAIGTSTPDLLTSVYVAMEGDGDMAVCNALGSNTFDVLIALGLPWFLYTLMGLPIEVDAGDMGLYTVILFATLLYTFILFGWNGWKLQRRIGVALFAWYILFVLFDVWYAFK